ncbi:MAG: c-type cytochrome [Candidatus Eisenbacteria bacterium]|nr:c-type cytochrome [Candidatus Eisenbacteria bacterium]
MRRTRLKQTTGVVSVVLLGGALLLTGLRGSAVERDAAAEHGGAQHAGVQHAGAEHAGAEHAGAEHAGMEHAGAEQAGAPPAGVDATPQRSGAELFVASGCARCHRTDRRETKIGPGLAGLFDRATLPVSGRAVTVENVRRQLDDPYGQMPDFGDRLSAEEKDRIVAYLETL